MKALLLTVVWSINLYKQCKYSRIDRIIFVMSDEYIFLIDNIITDSLMFVRQAAVT